MPIPNLFVVGAPKCGTTSMYHYLGQHPDIFMAAPKGPGFFGRDMNSPRFIKEEAEYLSLFSGSNGVRWRGEGSMYLLSQTAASEIRRASPDARILVLLRDPVEQIASLYWHKRYSGQEDLPTLREALDAEPARARGERIPPTAHFPLSLLYRRTARYPEHLRRFFANFPRDSIRVVLTEDLRARPEEVYRGVLDFLDVSRDFRPAFLIHNERQGIRSERFLDVVRRPPRFLLEALRVLAPVSVREALKRLLLRLNETGQRPDPLDIELRRMLAREYRPQVVELEEMLDRDLSGWCRESDTQ